MLGLICAASLLQTSPPAFLDARDAIKVWIPYRVNAAGPKPSIKVKIDGKDWPVSKVEAAGLIAAPSQARPDMVVLAGSLQHLFGGADWAPGDESSEMKSVAPGVFEFLVRLPKGRYEYKVARGGSWNENYGAGFVAGGGNVTLEVPSDGTPVRFRADFNAKRLGDSINNPDWVPVPTDAPRPSDKAVPGSVNVLLARLAKPIPPSLVASDIQILVDGGQQRRVYARDVLDDTAFRYEADDLGARYSSTSTTFKVWSPVSKSVALDVEGKQLQMTDAGHGVWARTIKGDLHGKRYRFAFRSYGATHIAADVNGYAASRDGEWSVVRNPRRTDPVGWNTKPLPRVHPTGLTIYEIHVRDFTIDPSSQVPEKWRGRYLGMTFDTKKQTGLSYLKWLGVNAVQLMPFQMFNPGHRGYNWGYETNLFNVPEPQYSTTPEDPINTIRETKAMIGALHQSGIRAIMDVVYNHSVPSEGPKSAFWQAVPYYYFRTDDKGTVLNESGVGNALNDDHPIVRKYIRDSLCYWVREYGIDGFRFDLLGMFRKASVVDWKNSLEKIKPGIFIYGEPWTGGGPLRFGKGDQRGTGVGVFNDNFRNAIRGDLDGPAPGFAMGGQGFEQGIVRGLNGSLDDFTTSPEETINYVSAHDNMTLWDKICLSMPNATDAERKRSLALCGALVLSAQGVPFLEGGAELGRQKGGNRNTYNAGDAANRFDWTRAKEFWAVAERYRALIASRKRFTSAKGIRDNVKISVQDGGVRLDTPSGAMFLNGTPKAILDSKSQRPVEPYGFEVWRKQP